MQSPPPIENPITVANADLPKQSHSSKNGRGKSKELKFNRKPDEVSPFRKGTLEAS